MGREQTGNGREEGQMSGWQRNKHTIVSGRLLFNNCANPDHSKTKGKSWTKGKSRRFVGRSTFLEGKS